MSYTTFNGEKKIFDELDHQHLSNIYWYNKIVNRNDDITLHDIIVKLKDKYGGTLPYHPHPDFKQEINALDRMGCLRWIDDRTMADIFLGSEKVGEFYTKDYIRNIKIEKLLEE